MKEEEVIGGDLSEFEVTKGDYYLCGCDILKSTTPDFFKWLFGDNINHKYNSQTWRAPRQSGAVPNKNSFRNPGLIKMKVQLGVNFNSESETDKIEKAVSSLVGVESVCIDKEIGRLTVVGSYELNRYPAFRRLGISNLDMSLFGVK
ncbi:hypothetical protein L1987_65699 [Smallanthus sonchifolius]|uniref:Uncharacterized protein n=1 Tax=Smallanthus sonchifolius TaxID=185202 RepID=A0ACB9BVE6_9ASTR|nr:hypothetical protein L1987_65699 [Smallanthus sonchifolius]